MRSAIKLILFGLAIGAGAALVLSLFTRRPAPVPDPPAVIERVKEVARLETLEVLLYKKVSFAPEPREAGSALGELGGWLRFTFDAPRGKAIVFAKAHLGVDASLLDASRVLLEGRRATVALPPVQARIELLPGETEVIGSNLDSAQTARLFDLAKQAFEREVEADAALQERARGSAERSIRALLLTAGFTEVRFVEELPRAEGELKETGGRSGGDRAGVPPRRYARECTRGGRHHGGGWRPPRSKAGEGGPPSSVRRAHANPYLQPPCRAAAAPASRDPSTFPTPTRGRSRRTPRVDLGTDPERDRLRGVDLRHERRELRVVGGLHPRAHQLDPLLPHQRRPLEPLGPDVAAPARRELPPRRGARRHPGGRDELEPLLDGVARPDQEREGPLPQPHEGLPHVHREERRLDEQPVPFAPAKRGGARADTPPPAPPRGPPARGARAPPASRP